MDLIFIITMGVVGLIVGFLIPELSNQIIEYKYEEDHIESSAGDMDNLFFKVAFSVFNGMAWTAAGFLMENSLAAFLFSSIISQALILSVIDIRVRKIPNELLLIGMMAGGSFQLVYYGIKSFMLALVCMIGMMILFLLVGLAIGMDKVGAGDVKLAGVMGLMLGYPGILVAALVMSLSFAGYTLSGILLKRMTLYSMLPFAPFMMLGLIGSLGWTLWVG